MRYGGPLWGFVGEWALVLALRPHRLGTELWSLEGGKTDSVLKLGRQVACIVTKDKVKSDIGVSFN